MAPSATQDLAVHPSAAIKDVASPLKATLPIPANTHGLDWKRPELISLRWISYTSRPSFIPCVLLFNYPFQDVLAIRNTPREHHDAGSRADKSKKNLFEAIKKNNGKVVDLTKNIGTEISGIRLDELTDEQKDEVALLVAERSVVFFRGQEGLSPKVQRDLGVWWGEVEVHPQVPHVPGLPGVTVIWPALQASEKSGKTDFRKPRRCKPMAYRFGARTSSRRAMTKSIVGLDKAESDLILGYLYDVFEKNVDIQVRFRWTAGTSAIWDNRITIHNASWDYEGTEERHGTRVTSLAEKPYYEAGAKSRREALGLNDD
ncbi:hypothetical protein DID88_008765 [Monilinia fructigena]|uniref:TauD/TfdA-like domain-containing protein n=1 Tax=Monilinia fructigena TaxID=38457 RepID=A0A395J6C1_9HELO|nr:hypothetical protein DID88_008765 [Monilinia fructigena]